jgi:hypothetical protein
MSHPPQIPDTADQIQYDEWPDLITAHPQALSL